jgi:DNA repair ATPase RecN
MTDYSGAKWYKVDFHMHTNASSDYRDMDNYTHEKWLLKCMEKKLDGVVVSDHNTGKNIDEIKNAYITLKNSENPNFRELVIFPSVELTVNNGIHLLVIFNEDETSSIITRLIGSVGLTGNEGDIEAVTKKSVIEILNIIEADYNAICIPAHVDKVKGIFHELTGITLVETLKNKSIIAIEQIDKNYNKPQGYINEKLFHNRLLGSDSHLLNDIAKNYSWLQMGRLSFHGLKMVLSDTLNKNIICSDEIERDKNPNNIEYPFIKSIQIKNGFKIGRGTPVKLQFSPWLNTIVGGRGSGKSTIIKMLQYTFGKNSNNRTDSDFFKIGSRNSKGMLTSNTEVEIELSQFDEIIKLKKENNKYFIDNIEKNIEVIQELYPIVLITQKELFSMALEQDKIFRFIDRKINFSQWEREFNTLKNDYFESKARERTLFSEVKNKQLIEENIKQTEKVLLTYKKYDFSDLIQEYRIYKVNSHKLNDVYAYIKKLEEQLQELEINNFSDKTNFSNEIDFLDENTPEISSFELVIDDIKKDISAKTSKLKELKNLWVRTWKDSEWQKKFDEITKKYDELQKELLEQGRNIDGYNESIKKLEFHIKQLKSIENIESEYTEQCSKSSTLERKIKEKRKELFTSRKEYIDDVNVRLKEAYGSIRVKFDIEYMGNAIESENEFRTLIEKTDGRFDSDILLIDTYNENNSIGILWDIENSENKEDTLDSIKNKLFKIRENSRDFNGWFVNHIESIFNDNSKKDRLITWFPKDKLKVTIVLNGREEDIETASPGQKATALMTYIITETDGPLIIDQPEDDLDNRMVSSLIVDGIRGIKLNRQVIVITHNPNIPVNASAEKIFEMNFVRGQISVKKDGTLQDKNIRESICDVMEGGVDALKHRFNKILKI